MSSGIYHYILGESTMSTNNVKVTFDAVLLYAQVQKPSKFGKYTVDLIPAGISKAEEDKVVKLGAIPKTNFNEKALAEIARMGLTGAQVFRAEKGIVTKGGKTLTPPSVVDAQGNPLTTLLGNGTKARIHATISRYLSEGELKTKLYLDVVQVFDLVTFSSGPKVAPMEGYTTTADTKTTDVPPMEF